MKVIEEHLSDDEIRRRMMELAGHVGMTVDEVCAAIEAGAFDGTIFKSKMSSYRFLLDRDL